MIYRMRIYRAVTDNLPLFHEFFRTHLLPVQLRHGARLVGRWETEDSRVVAVWEYDDREAYERVQAAVVADPASRHAQEVRQGLPPLFTEKDEVFMKLAPERCGGGQRSPTVSLLEIRDAPHSVSDFGPKSVPLGGDDVPPCSSVVDCGQTT